MNLQVSVSQEASLWETSSENCLSLNPNTVHFTCSWCLLRTPRCSGLLLNTQMAAIAEALPAPYAREFANNPVPCLKGSALRVPNILCTCNLPPLFLLTILLTDG